MQFLPMFDILCISRLFLVFSCIRKWTHIDSCYWQEFSDLQHFTEPGREVELRDHRSGAVTLASSPVQSSHSSVFWILSYLVHWVDTALALYKAADVEFEVKDRLVM